MKGHLTTDDGETFISHECGYCSEETLGEYCNATCRGRAEGVDHCTDCNGIIDCETECPADVPGSHQRVLYDVECPGCDERPIGYRHRGQWVVACDGCTYRQTARTLAAAIEQWRDPPDADDEAMRRGDYERDRLADFAMEAGK